MQEEFLSCYYNLLPCNYNTAFFSHKFFTQQPVKNFKPLLVCTSFWMFRVFSLSLFSSSLPCWTSACRSLFSCWSVDTCLWISSNSLFRSSDSTSTLFTLVTTLEREQENLKIVLQSTPPLVIKPSNSDKSCVTLVAMSEMEQKILKLAVLTTSDKSTTTFVTFLEMKKNKTIEQTTLQIQAIYHHMYHNLRNGKKISE